MSRHAELQQWLAQYDENPSGFLWAAPEKLFNGSCLLLNAAEERIRERQPFEMSPSARWDTACDALHAKYFGTDPNASPLFARRLLIEAANTHDDPGAVRRRLEHAIEVYWAAWGGAQPAEDQPADTGRKPAWWGRLPNDGWRRLFAELADQRPWGWYDPALGLAGDTLAGLFGSLNRPSDWSVRTWLLFALKEDGESIDGLVAELTMTRVPDGCGCFYPDPITSGYVRMAADFQKSLRNAWRTEIEPHLMTADYVDFDVCLNVRVLDTKRRFSPDSPRPVLTGRSGEAALCCALRAIRRKEPLDEKFAVTAQLRSPPDDTRLQKVESVLDKLQAREFRGKVKHAFIQHLLVAKNQEEAGSAYDNGELTVTGVATLDEAYDQISRYSKAIQLLRAHIDQQATAELRRDCIGEVTDGYVHPRLSRREGRPFDPLRAMRDEPGRDPYEPLSSDERDLITSGRYWLDENSPRLLRFFADSGAGKSMLLVYCEQQLARAPNGWVPLRLKRLSEVAWQADDPYREIARHLTWDDRDRLSDDQRRQLVQRLCEAGRLVLLLDALDQTTTLQGLSGWLNRESGKLVRCPTLVTGRPSTETLPIFDERDGHWETFRVDPFQRAEQEELLGPQLSNELLLQRGEDERSHPLKAHWQPLLETPMLLKMMKQLAHERKLGGLTNRERVYTAATNTLIRRGYESHRTTARLPLTVETTNRLLSVLAWESIAQDHNFTGVVQGTSYERALECLGQTLEDRPRVEEALDQINLFTRFSFLGHRQQDGIEWRHRSFLEYFAAIHLTDSLHADEQATCIARVQNALAAVEHVKRQRLASDEMAGGERLIAPPEQWQWVYRFALLRLQASPNPDRLNHLARQLIAHGNPHVVYDAMRDDGLKLDPDLDQLCRWLVHQTWTYEKDYRDAWPAGSPPAAKLQTLAILQTLFERQYRNSSCLPPAWQLIQDACKSSSETVRQKAAGIRQNFLQEIGRLHRAPAMQQFLASFCSCPPQPPKSGQPVTFEMGASPGDNEAFDHEKPRHRVRLRPFEMADFSVTNQVYELFDPSHFWWRDQYSDKDDQPVMYVNWFMADVFCQWLSGENEGQYRLPTEAEYEYAARGGKTTRHWWGTEFDASRCNSDFRIGRTMGRRETTAAYRNDYGLCHMLGNINHWCADYFQGDWYRQRTGAAGSDAISGHVFQDEGGPSAGSSRVVRGGSFNVGDRGCRCSVRFDIHPGDLDNGVGFRVVRAAAGPSRPQ